jgi:hypothetical protein
MRLIFRAALAALPFMLAASAGAQTPAGQNADGIAPIGSVLPADVVRDLPLGDTIYSVLENVQSEVISDRFNSGGINVGSDARLGGFLGSWSQTMFRVGDVDVTDPSGSGAPLLFPDASLWQSVNIATGLMPADVNTPGLAVTLDPRRAGSTWTRMFTGSGSGGSLAAAAPANQPVPIARLSDFARGSGLIAGPLSDRLSLVAAGTWARGAALLREQLASTKSTNVSGFAHLVFAPRPDREWRTLAWVQRTETPFDSWQALGNPTATTDNTAVHLQSTLERRPADGARWRVFAGYTQRDRMNDPASTDLRLERISGGPVPGLVDATADVTARRLSLGGRFAPYAAPDSRHRLSYGADAGYASTATSGLFAGTVREQVNGIPARIWSYTAPGGSTSNRAVTTVSAFARDIITLSPRLTIDAGVRAEVIHGRAEGAATAVDWLTVLPHAYLRWQAGAQRALILGYARSAHALNQTWLAFGDPAASIATVAAAAAPSVVVTRVGPGTGGNPALSGIDADLKRPYTDEFVVGLEKRRSAATRYSLTGIARRQGNTLGVVNTLTTIADYSTIAIQDAGKDWVGPDDDRTLLAYNRLPASFGRDAYLVTNPDQQAPTAFALRMQWEYATPRLFMLFGATASAAMGPVSSRGYGPLENDQDQPGEVHINPNAASYARGRLFNDRAFTIKWTTLYRFPWDVTVAGIARYQDGQPFSRLVVVPTLNQGVEGIQAYPNAGSRYTFIGTLDLRLQKGIRAGGTRVDAILDAYNLFTRNNSVEEDIVTSPAFRTPIAIQPPRSVHVGLRLTF